MSISSKTAARLLLLTILSFLVSPGFFGSGNRVAGEHLNPVQAHVEQDISGSYKGLVLLFRDKGETQCLMAGLVKLEIKGKQFTLSKPQGKTLKGEITTLVRSGNENLAVGQLTPENEKAIEIRWYRDAKSNVLKILSAQGADRYFRFCSASLTINQCFGRI
jgi:hypothetical protein